MNNTECQIKNYLNEILKNDLESYNKFQVLVQNYKDKKINQKIFTEKSELILKRHPKFLKLLFNNNDIIVQNNENLKHKKGFAIKRHKIKKEVHPSIKLLPYEEYEKAVYFVMQVKKRFAKTPKIYEDFLNILYNFSCDQTKLSKKIYLKKSEADEIIFRTKKSIFRLLNGENDLIETFKYFLTKSENTNTIIKSLVDAENCEKNPKILNHRTNENKPLFPPNSEHKLQFLKEIKEILPKNLYILMLRSLNLFSKDIVGYKELIHILSDTMLPKYPNIFNKFKNVMGLNQINHKFDQFDKNGELKDMITPSYIINRNSDYNMDKNLNDKFEIKSFIRNKNVNKFKTKYINVYEEKLHRLEDDRYEIDMILEINNSIIDSLSKILNKPMIKEENKENKTPSETLNIVELRVIKKMYADKADKMIEMIDMKPEAAIPIIIARCNQKNIEWLRIKNNLKNYWRKLCNDNWLKARIYKSEGSLKYDYSVYHPAYLIAELKSLKYIYKPRLHSQKNNKQDQLSPQSKNKQTFLSNENEFTDYTQIENNKHLLFLDYSNSLVGINIHNQMFTLLKRLLVNNLSKEKYKKFISLWMNINFNLFNLNLFRNNINNYQNKKIKQFNSPEQNKSNLPSSFPNIHAPSPPKSINTKKITFGLSSNIKVKDLSSSSSPNINDPLIVRKFLSDRNWYLFIRYHQLLTKTLYFLNSYFKNEEIAFEYHYKFDSLINILNERIQKKISKEAFSNTYTNLFPSTKNYPFPSIDILVQMFIENIIEILNDEISLLLFDYFKENTELMVNTAQKYKSDNLICQLKNTIITYFDSLMMLYFRKCQNITNYNSDSTNNLLYLEYIIPIKKMGIGVYNKYRIKSNIKMKDQKTYILKKKRPHINPELNKIINRTCNLSDLRNKIPNNKLKKDIRSTFNIALKESQNKNRIINFFPEPPKISHFVKNQSLDFSIPFTVGKLPPPPYRSTYVNTPNKKIRAPPSIDSIKAPLSKSIHYITKPTDNNNDLHYHK